MKQHWHILVSGAAALLSAAALVVAVLGATVLDDKARTTKAATPAFEASPRSQAATSATGISTATFAIRSSYGSLRAGDFVQILEKALPAGSWVVVATVNLDHSVPGPEGHEVACELRHGANFIGGATVRPVTPPATRGPTGTYTTSTKTSLTMNGGAQIGGHRGGVVSVWCKSNTIYGGVTYAQMMMLKVDGFS